MVKPIDQMGLGPTRGAVQDADGNWDLTVTPPKWSGFSASTIKLTPDQYRRYQNWMETNCSVQMAFPELSPAEREIIMSGICDEEFKKVTPD